MRDIFVSYAHADNERFNFAPEGLISLLHSDLEAWARLRPEPRPEVWLDRARLAAGEVFNEAIARALDDAKVLLPIISPRWRESEYCQKEWFRFWSRTGASADGSTRVIPILFNYESEQIQSFPEPLKTLHFDPLLRYKVGMEREEYAKFFSVLTTELTSRLAQIPASPPSVNGPKAASVLVAHAVGQSLREARTVVINELVTQKFEVIDGRVSDEDDAASVIRVIKEAFPSCIAAIHFLGDNLGQIPPGSGETRQSVQLQFEEVSRLQPRLQVGFSEQNFRRADSVPAMNSWRGPGRCWGSSIGKWMRKNVRRTSSGGCGIY